MMSGRTSRPPRTSSIAAARKISSQIKSETAEEPRDRKTPAAPGLSATRDTALPRRRALVQARELAEAGEVDLDERALKKRKVTKGSSSSSSSSHASRSALAQILARRRPSSTSTTRPAAPADWTPAIPPSRHHTLQYHRPLLLGHPPSRSALLSWFDKTSSLRRMPWRKPFLSPDRPSSGDDGDDDFRSRLERRAYEVWISEIMLQQTRVAVVIDYWARWMARWPTIHDLAAASPDKVLSAWRGLGYYSRATRIHDAAKMVVADPEMKGLLPAAVDGLMRVPGIGRYTAGAVAAIVYGVPAPMVDGNVLRVLSRQMGLLGNVKADKRVIDALWDAADALVKEIARGEGEEVDEDDDAADGDDGHAELPTDRPGRWGQALMELGSTVCTPKPNCAACPIKSTCRAYAEGRVLAGAQEAQDLKQARLDDIEDLCTLCEPFHEDGVDPRAAEELGKQADEHKQQTTHDTRTAKAATKRKTKSPYFVAGEPKMTSADQVETIIVDHARKFPLKVAKKAVREEETLVCAIRRNDGNFLIEKRPDKGLLAGMWELPSLTIGDDGPSSTLESRTKAAESHIADLLALQNHNHHHHHHQHKKQRRGPAKSPLLVHLGELGSIPWLFSHLKLTMHVHLFDLDGAGADGLEVRGVGCNNNKVDQAPRRRRRWATPAEISDESMGTGMRKCWALAVAVGSGADRHSAAVERDDDRP